MSKYKANAYVTQTVYVEFEFEDNGTDLDDQAYEKAISEAGFPEWGDVEADVNSVDKV